MEGSNSPATSPAQGELNIDASLSPAEGPHGQKRKSEVRNDGRHGLPASSNESYSSLGPKRPAIVGTAKPAAPSSAATITARNVVTTTSNAAIASDAAVASAANGADNKAGVASSSNEDTAANGTTSSNEPTLAAVNASNSETDGPGRSANGAKRAATSSASNAYFLPSAEKFYPPGKGLVVLFNINKRREGSEADVEAITTIFEEKFKFEVLPFQDFSKADLPACHRQVKERLEAGEFASLTLFIFAHGGKDPCTDREFIMDAKDAYVDIKEFFLKIYNTDELPDKCKDKPKLCLMQACRNLVDDGDPAVQARLKQMRDDARKRGQDRAERRRSRSRRGRGESPTDGHKHFYVLKGTMEEEPAHRHPKFGSSYFITALCGALNECPSIEINDLKLAVAEALKDTCPDQTVDVTHNSLQYKFRFAEIPAPQDDDDSNDDQANKVDKVSFLRKACRMLGLTDEAVGGDTAAGDFSEAMIIEDSNDSLA